MICGSFATLQKSGEHIDADFIISATGLTMQHNFPFSTIKVIVDGKEYKASDHLIYNGIMISDVPNFAFIIGRGEHALLRLRDSSGFFSGKK